MRKNSWLQKLLYGVMAVLGAYIMYKSGALLAACNQMQKKTEAGSVQQSAEDTAMRTWSLAYTAAVEGKKLSGWLSTWFGQVVPVLSYVVEEEGGQALAQNETEAEKESETATETQTGTDAQMQTETVAETQTWTDAQMQTETAAETQAGTAVQMQTETAAETETQTAAENDAIQEVSVGSIFSQALPLLTDFSYLVTNYYTVDEDTAADAELIDAEKLLGMDLSLEQDSSVPQILIYHTHSQEAFADSAEGEVRDTVVGMGEILADELRGYGYNVIHDTGVYDLVDGVLDRSAAYDYAREAIEAILEENPTIEVVIDLHRDGVEGDREDFVTEIDGEDVSRIMFFNGLSRNAGGEALTWLPNEYLTENLAFSLQLQVLANVEYPGFTRKIYLQAERYNLHLRARSLLIETGTQLNTVEEEKNAMAPVANLIRQILE
ncbi:MAG: stage II sporulation protein P [Lachnospiraceae bacterium]|nr:stage II sporulation protein P [Lachnospiraceae bacterium]